jgi:pimeloyl-ACP methyl ester carboxylesterase
MSLRIFLVEINGLPNLSDGATPDIKGLDYGVWAGEVMKNLQLNQAYVAGASFGGLICMKLALVHPELIKAAFLLNPGCLQPFSLRWQNLYYNLLPTVKNVTSFLDKAVFCKPNHRLSVHAEQMLIDYEVFAISRYKDSTQKPYYMGDQLSGVTVPTYLFEGDKDLLFPYERSITNAREHIQSLLDVKVYPDVGHGIEVYPKAIADIGQLIRNDT